jgi:hypothetical protein
MHIAHDIHDISFKAYALTTVFTGTHACIYIALYMLDFILCLKQY